MPRPRTTHIPSTVFGIARRVGPAAAALAVFGLLGSCTGERPSLGPARPGISSTTLTSTATTAPPKATLGPDSLLGYIATPNATPVVRAEPRDNSLAIEIPKETEAGAPTTFAVIGNPAADAGSWLQVLLPTRPNGTTAWVPASSVKITKTDLRIFVDLNARALRVERAGREILAKQIAIGNPANPTPVGASYVTELIDNNEPAGAYGPYAFGLALHSDTLSEFGGGDGQVGIHGTNQPKLIGQAVSHGCVRLTNADVVKLVGLNLPLGVPVFIS